MDALKQSILLLGSNLGHRQDLFTRALILLGQRSGKIGRRSSVYETAAWGNTNQPLFLNQVVEIHTRLDPYRLLDTILEIEKEMGRKRAEKWGSRIIDIDILFYENTIIHDARLQLPHPELHNRRFTLVPLNELFPTLIHPVLHVRVTDLLAACNDPLGVQLFSKA